MTKKLFKIKNTHIAWIVLTQISLLLMESIILSLWYKKLASLKFETGLVTLIFFIISLITFYLSITLRSFKIKRSISYLVLIFLSLVIYSFFFDLQFQGENQIPILTNLLSPFLDLVKTNQLSSQMVFLIFFLLILFRSVWYSAQVIDSNTIIDSIKISLLLLIAFGLLRPSQTDLPFFLPVIFYFFISLFTLSTSRVNNLAYTRGGQLPQFSINWLLTFLLSSLTILTIAWLSGWFLGTQVSHLIIIIFFVLIGVILFVALIITAPIILILNFIIQTFAQSITTNPIPQTEEIQVLENPLTEAILENVENLDQLMNQPGSGIVIIISILLIILLFMVFQFLHRKPWRQANLSSLDKTEKIEEESPSKKKSGRTTQGFGINTIKKWLIANQVRRIYFSFLEKCNQLDLKRNMGETPLEFQTRLIIVLPDLFEEIRTITEAYNRIRYGLYPESDKEVQAVSSAWTKFKKLDKKNKTGSIKHS